MTQNQNTNINLSRFWNSNLNKFTIRFKDLIPTKKTLLAQRIKICSHIYRTRHQIIGPSTEQIQETLEIINPIIFSEALEGWYTRESRENTYKTFGNYAATSLSGWIFKRLCQAIYHLTYRKKPLTRPQLRNIIYLTTGNSQQEEINNYLNNHFPQQQNENTPNQEPLSITEIGIEDLLILNTEFE